MNDYTFRLFKYGLALGGAALIFVAGMIEGVELTLKAEKSKKAKTAKAEVPRQRSES
jgi:hypothetical protein